MNQPNRSGLGTGTRRAARVVVTGLVAAVVGSALVAPSALASTSTHRSGTGTGTSGSSGTGTSLLTKAALGTAEARGQATTTASRQQHAVKVKDGAAGAVGSRAATGTVSPRSALAGTPGYVPLSPARVLDTRGGLGARKGPVGQRSTITLPVLGRGGVPASGVAAVVLNVTATAATTSTFVTVFPNGTSVPSASNLNLTAGATIANLVIVKVGTGGAVQLYNHNGSVHLVADVAGYMATGSSYVAQSPTRILDTRGGLGAPKAPVKQRSTLTVQVAGRGGVPATGVAAVAMNVTAVGATTSTFVTVFPAGGTVPTASNLNPAAGQTVPVLTMATLSATGAVSFYNHNGSVDLVADVAGWYTPNGEYHPLTPARIFDTRTIPGGALPGGYHWDIQATGWGGVPTTGASAVVLSVTAVNPTKGGFLTVYPYAKNSVVPGSSNVNFAAKQTIPNLVIARVGAGGWISISNSAGSVDLVVDVTGWFSTTSTQGLTVGSSESQAVNTNVTGAAVPVTTVGGVSADGRYTLFTSTDPSLAPYRTSTQPAAYVRDSVLGITTVVFDPAAWGLPDSAVTGLSMSADGRYVLWTSTAGVVAGDKNGVGDVYLSDLVDGWILLMSYNSTLKTAGNAPTTSAAISPNGQWVALSSSASNLVSNDTDGVADVFVSDIVPSGRTLTLAAPVSSAGLTSQAVANDGSVTFVDPAGAVTKWDKTTASSSLVSQSTSGTAGTGSTATISADGRYVAFMSPTSLVAGDTNIRTDVYVRDTTGNTTSLVTATPAGAAANALSQDPVISADGTSVVFSSYATDLLASPMAGGSYAQVFRRVLATGENSLVSATAAGVAGNGSSVTPKVSSSGAYVEYLSGTTNLTGISVIPQAVLTRVA